MAVSLSNSPETLSSSWIPAALPSCEMQRVQELTQMGVVRPSTNAPLTWDAIHNLSHDHLTGLPLGHLFHARVDYLLEAELNKAARQQQESFVSVVEQPAVCLNQRLSLAAALQEQLAASTLPLQVTPIVNLRTGAAHSYHVAPMMQMNGEDVPFETLMLHAERAGIMNALQQHVFAKSIERYAAANVERTYLNIPISPMDISNQGLANYLSTLMRKHNLPSHSVRLDVHTPKPTRCWQQAIEDLFELQQIGTPFHAARQNGRSQHANNISGQSRQRVYWIPGSLLERALKKPSEQQMLTTLVDLARSLGIDTMASRVTSQAQADLALQSGMLYGCGPAIAGDVPLTMVR